MSHPTLQRASKSIRPLPLLLLILGSGLSSLSAQPNGIDQKLTFDTPTTGGKFIQWYGISGRTYFIQVSDATDHLNKWKWLPIIEGGNNQSISYEVDGTADKAFFRLQYTDQTAADLDNADFDGDGLTNLQEITALVVGNKITQTNPLDPDTDHDGLKDKFERDHGLDPTDDGSINPNNGPNGIPNGDGITNSAAQAAANQPPPDLSTQLVYRGVLYAEQQFDFGAYAQTTLYSKSLVDYYRSTLLSNYVIKAPTVFGSAVINTDNAYITPHDTSDPQNAYAANGFFKSFFKNKFPIPSSTTTDDLSTWSLANLALNFGLTYRDVFPSYTLIDANEATYEFAIRAAGASPQARQEKRTLLQLLKTTNTSSPGNLVVTYAAITPPTVEMNFTIPAGKMTSASQRVSTPTAKIVGEEDKIKELFLVPLDIEPDANMAGVVGDLVAPINPASKTKHFVTPKKSNELAQEYVEIKAIGVDTATFNQFLEWDGGEAVPNEPLKRRVTRSVVDMTQVKIKVKQGGAVAAEMQVWVVWCDVTTQSGVANYGIYPLGSIYEVTLDPGWRFVFKIKPESILDQTNNDRPKLSDVSRKSPPGAGKTYTIKPNLGDGDRATMQWDVSRQYKLTLHNPGSIPKADFEQVNYPAAWIVNQPAAIDTPISFPAKAEEGNDDPIDGTQIDEEVNPYAAYNGTLRLNHQIGEISSYDAPSLRAVSFLGAAARTLSIEYNFREFARVELWDGKRNGGQFWFKISDFIDWHHYLDAIYDTSTSSWNNRTSSSGTGHPKP